MMKDILRKKHEHDVSVFLSVETSNGIRFYRVTPTKKLVLSEVSEIDENSLIWRVSGNDIVFAPEKRPNEKLLKNRAISVLRERTVAIVHKERNSKRYAMTKRSTPTVSRMPCRPFGLAIPMDQLEGPCIVRVDLDGEYCVLGVLDKRQMLYHWTLAVSSDSASLAERMVQQNSLGAAPLVDGKSAAEYIAEAPSVRFYPVEREWYGVTVRKWSMMAAIGGVALFGISVLGVSRNSVELMLLNHQYSKLVSQRSREQSELKRWDRHHVDYAVKRRTVNFRQILVAANSIWVPGSLVSVQDNGKQIIVEFPNENFQQFAHGQWTSLRGIHYVLSRGAPKGWYFAGLFRGDGGVFYATYKKR